MVEDFNFDSEAMFSKFELESQSWTVPSHTIKQRRFFLNMKSVFGGREVAPSAQFIFNQYIHHYHYITHNERYYIFLIKSDSSAKAIP